KTFLTSLIENYGLTMAWYGVYKDGEVRPSVHAGKADKYLQGLSLDIKQPDSPDAKCAMSIAIIGQRPFGYADLANDEGFTRWRDYALELGYASNLAIPLAVGGAIEGGVMIYSNGKGAFPTDRAERFSLLTRELGAIIGERRAYLKAEEEKDFLRAQLLQSQKMEAIGTLAGGIAHDFNNILAVIMGTAGTALNRLPGEDPNFVKFSRILRSSERAKDLIMKLLTFARKEKVDVKPVPVNNIVSDLIDMISRAIPKNISLNARLSEAGGNVMVDVNQVHQALLNICINAADAMPAGGSLMIDVSEEYVHRSKARRYQFVVPGRFFKISISDTGSGIPEDITNNIFDPFFTTKEKGKGTGLGLSVTLGIVRNHGGFITVSNSDRGGAVIDVFLPAAVEEPQPEQVALPDAGMRGNETILIVDDEEPFLEMLAEELASEGYKPICSDSGVKAVEIYSANHPKIAVVILDMGMPGMDGLETFRALKQIDPNVKVVVSSGYQMPEKAVKIMDEGATAFMRKPFMVPELFAKIREILD
ncbi:MAG TPA: response regulator, partial [bacterium]|nr:response regulator [bacterium]